MTETQQEMVEHTVEIDKYMTITLNIPKHMTALDMKAITSKANKLFNLAEIPLVENGVVKRGYSENRVGRTFWTPEKNEQLISLFKQGKTNKEISVIFGLKASQIGSRKWDMKSKGLLDKGNDERQATY